MSTIFIPGRRRFTQAKPKAKKVKLDVDKLVNKFLSWQLPKDVCSDRCVSEIGYPGRSGTNLLTADQARKMIEYLLDQPEPKRKRSIK